MRRKEQNDTHSQRRAAHDWIQNDRVRPRYVDFEEPKVRRALRGEVRETGNGQGDDARPHPRATFGSVR